MRVADPALPGGAARPGVAVLEGFHALKHALRFGAEWSRWSPRTRRARPAGGRAGAGPGRLARRPGGAGQRRAARRAGAAGAAHRVVAIARRPAGRRRRGARRTAAGAVVLLEDPRTMGNMGACVRVAAAADAAAVLTTGDNDPWHPDALRGAAGLHFALPVAGVEALPTTSGRWSRSTPGARACARPTSRGASSPSAPSATVSRRAARSRRRPPRHPDAPRRLQPQPRDRGRRRPVCAAALRAV